MSTAEQFSPPPLPSGVSLVLARSANWHISDGISREAEWTPEWDKSWFLAVRQPSTNGSNKAILMGSKTYDANQEFIRPKKEVLRVVMTSDPDQYKQSHTPGELEFWTDSPRVVVERLLNMGYTTILHLGGAELAHAFLDENLIDQAFLTVVPIEFEEGVALDPDQFLSGRARRTVLYEAQDGSTLEQYSFSMPNQV